MDKREWQTRVRLLNGNFHGQELRPETAVTWFEEGELGQYETWLVSLAVRRIIRSHDFMPRSVAGFLRVIEEVRAELAHQQAEDATRTCPGCATEDTPGWVEGEGGWHPCGDCRPGRYEAWATTRKGGFPEVRGSRNLMAVPFDKATGYPKGRAEGSTAPMRERPA